MDCLVGSLLPICHQTLKHNGITLRFTLSSILLDELKVEYRSVRIYKEKEKIQEERCREKIHFVSLVQESWQYLSVICGWASNVIAMGNVYCEHLLQDEHLVTWKRKNNALLRKNWYQTCRVHLVTQKLLKCYQLSSTDTKLSLNNTASLVSFSLLFLWTN